MAFRLALLAAISFCVLAWAARPVRAGGLVLDAIGPGESGLQVDAALVSPALPLEHLAGTSGKTYTVRQGDTLTAIAAQLGVDAASLVGWNELSNPDRIEVGQILRVSASQAADVALPRGGELVRLQLWPWPPRQGQTVAVWIQARDPVTFSLSLDDASYPVQSSGRRGWALVPIAALAQPGERLLRISAGSASQESALDSQNRIFDLPVPVEAGQFDSYDVPASASAPILSQASKVRAEAARLAALFSDRSSPGWNPRDRFALPLAGDMPTTSAFGSRRTYGGGSSVSAHEGEDLSAPPGTPVTAPAPATVVLAEPLFVRGNAVVLDHGNGVFTGYWHMQSLAVKAGDRVRAGDTLGEVGSTGLSTGAHLHWEMRVSGVPIDPMQWLAP